jgi:protein arginine kinase
MNNNQISNQQIGNNSIQTNNNGQHVSKNIQTNFVKNKEKAKSVKLIRFQYKVKDSEGKIVESYFDAENQLDVQSFLLNKGYEIVSIKEDKLSTSLGFADMSATRKMSSKECNKLVSDVKLGIDLGIIKNVASEKINQLSIYTKPASLQKYFGEILTEEERDIKRCEIIKKILK